MTLKDLYNILMEVGITVSHYEANLDTFPYIVFQELGTSYSLASGRIWREVTRVRVEYFTKDEWDKTLDALKIALLRKKINFTTATIWYEDTKVICTSFDFSIAREFVMGGINCEERQRNDGL
ncbi:MAG: hypothetical protein FWB91_01995 [Defluviitaleaceae bacterium]|nr:hypothetical protein [Defluviitaleaceae bacterium]